MNISNRWDEELFKEKHVKCEPKLYRQMFNEIWGCPHFFTAFLQATDMAVKVEYAKKIFAYYQSTNDVILPNTFFLNLIDLQTDLVSSPSKYIPQDHVIHSVNLYILGIALFFNYDIFHQLLARKTYQTETSMQQIRAFIKKWKVASLCHDLGYVFELFDFKNSRHNIEVINSYNKIYDDILNELVVRGVGRLVACTSFLDKTSLSFHINDISYLTGAQLKCNGDTVKYSQMVSELSKFDGAHVITDNSTKLSLLHFPNQICANCLLILYDEHDLPESLIILKNGRPSRIYYESESPCDYRRILLDADLFYVRQKYTCRFYFVEPIKEIRSIISRSFQGTYTNLFVDFPRNLPYTYRTQLEQITDDTGIEEFVYDIGRYIKGNQMSAQERSFNRTISLHYINEIKNCICNFVDQNLSRQNLNAINLPDNLQILFSKLSKETTLSNMITENVNEKYNNNEGNTIDVVNLPENAVFYIKSALRKKAKRYWGYRSNEAELAKVFAYLDFFEVTDKMEIHLSPFRGSLNALNCNTFEVKLLEKIKVLASQLNLNLEEICNYTPQHSTCDHGIVSACLLYQSTVFFYHLFSICSEVPFSLFAWHNCEYSEIGNEEKLLEMYSEVIFSILLHNIYVKSSAHPNGLVYRQNIEVNPFSYFLAFCDNIQKWSRPKQNNPAFIALPKGYYVEDKFDLLIDDGKVLLVCSSENINSLKSDINSAEEFLSGISQIVQVSDGYRHLN